MAAPNQVCLPSQSDAALAPPWPHAPMGLIRESSGRRIDCWLLVEHSAERLSELVDDRKLALTHEAGIRSLVTDFSFAATGP
jgi:hypothetical protein